MTAFLKRGLKLRHLQLLATLQDSGQLGQAAEDLGMAQPAASRLMAEIEAIQNGFSTYDHQGQRQAHSTAAGDLARRF